MDQENVYNAPPFGAPMSNFMQAGNISLTPTLEIPAEEFTDEIPIGESPPSSSAQTGFPPFGSTPPTTVAQTTNQEKYQIVDLFWMINPGLYAQPPRLVQGQAQFVVLSYNISFGNLRVSFFNVSQNSIQNNVVFLNNMQRTVSGTIYPASAFCAFNSPRIATVCLEQLFQSTGADWQQNRPVCKIEKNENKIRFTIEDSKSGKYFYDFENWQKDAFLYACQFAYTTGMYLNGLNKINK